MNHVFVRKEHVNNRDFLKKWNWATSSKKIRRNIMQSTPTNMFLP